MSYRHLLIAVILFGNSISTVLALDHPGYHFETISDQLENPWSVAFLPEGGFLVSQLHGELRRISADGTLGPAIANVPPTYYKSQGGFFDVVLDPRFEQNQTLYLAFAHGTPTDNATRVVRARLEGDKLENVRPIFTVKNTKDTPVHYGGKLLFLNDGTLLLTTGDGFDYREAAQDPFNQLGKIVRFNTDGTVPDDNPFADGAEADPYVYTMGHRSPQGLAIDRSTRLVYMHEHGPKGGDEVNLVSAGSNYGWPVTSNGINYSGAKISPFEALPGITGPIKFWTPSIAPSGLTFYDGDEFPEWKGDLFVGALVDQDVKRLEMRAGKVISEQSVFSELGQRVRDVRTGPDGALYLLTEQPGEAAGKLVRVTAFEQGALRVDE